MAVASYDLILVGSGFASSFFLHRALKYLGKDARVLVLEAGARDPHHWQMANGRNSSIPYAKTYVNRTPQKPWVYSPGFGGSSKCWWACTPRMLPADFELNTRYGVGLDWPISYSDLEEYYCDAEEVMAISGPEDSPFERSRPYPQPPHNLTDPDKILKKAFPDAFYVQPSGRTRVATKRRGVCCSSGKCRLCPINVKFTVENELMWLYEDPRVELQLGARALGVVIEGGVAKGVRYVIGGHEVEVKGEVVGLGTNAIFNPFLLMKSGLKHELLGKNLCEQLSTTVLIDLDGVDNFQGSTSYTGHGYLHYDGEHRRERAGALIETKNIPRLRHEKGRWRQRLVITYSFENLLDSKSGVSSDVNDKIRPVIDWKGDTEYALKSLRMVRELTEEFAKPLPVEKMHVPKLPEATVSHNMCTTVMGTDPKSSIVDSGLVHHDVRNLLVLGASVFPTASPANPTLTLSALSLLAADRFYA